MVLVVLDLMYYDTVFRTVFYYDWDTSRMFLCYDTHIMVLIILKHENFWVVFLGRFNIKGTQIEICKKTQFNSGRGK